VSEDLTGRRLGHYRIEGVIGRGGMSVMYRATDMRLGRKVALKVIGDQLASDPEFRERFVDEARNTSAIDHAHVVPLYDFDEIEGRLYIAMRYVEGSDLASLIKDGPISSTRTLTLLGQVAEALDALHGRGLVHLDVKPANVLVTQKESVGTEHVYLADFGLTRRGATGHRTRSGDFLGSPTYAAPEHLRGEPVDGRTDQYSLTCVLFACLTGRPPFTGKVPDVIAGHLGSEPPAITQLVLLPGQIDEVVRRGMAKDPGRRYASCRELLTAARSALAATPVPSEPPRRAETPTGTPAGAHSAAPPSPPPRQPSRGPAGPPGYPAQPHGPGQGWTPQGRPATPHPGGRYQPPAYQPPAPVGPAPMRLRDPLPAQSSAFTTRSDGVSWWVPAVLGLLAVAVVIGVVIIAMTRDGGGNAPNDPTGPSVDVPTTTAQTLPTNIPTVSR
jgi:serine/threonine protein kinase